MKRRAKLKEPTAACLLNAPPAFRPGDSTRVSSSQPPNREAPLWSRVGMNCGSHEGLVLNRADLRTEREETTTKTSPSSPREYLQRAGWGGLNSKPQCLHSEKATGGPRHIGTGLGKRDPAGRTRATNRPLNPQLSRDRKTNGGGHGERDAIHARIDSLGG